MNRRNLLAIAPVFVLLGCQKGATPQTRVQTDAALITAGMIAVASAVQASPKLTAEDKATVTQAVTTLQDANAAVQKAIVTPGGPAQQIAAAVREVAPIAMALLPAGSPEVIALQAALNLVPVFLASAGVAVPAAGAARVAMTAEQARAALRGVGK